MGTTGHVLTYAALSQEFPPSPFKILRIKVKFTANERRGPTYSSKTEPSEAVPLFSLQIKIQNQEIKIQMLKEEENPRTEWDSWKKTSFQIMEGRKKEGKQVGFVAVQRD